MYTYMNIRTHTHTHTHIYMHTNCIHILIINMSSGYPRFPKLSFDTCLYRASFPAGLLGCILCPY